MQPRKRGNRQPMNRLCDKKMGRFPATKIADQTGKCSKNKSIEEMNGRRIDSLSSNIGLLKDAISALSINVSVQAETLHGFRELYASELSHIHRLLHELKASEPRITAVESQISAARGSLKALLMAWSGVVALAGVVAEWLHLILRHDGR